MSTSGCRVRWSRRERYASGLDGFLAPWFQPVAQRALSTPGTASLTSVEIPYSIACALPSLTVIDITNDVSHELQRSGHRDGIAYISPTDENGIVRVNERETGFFEDLEDLLERLVPFELDDRERLVRFLIGPRTEQIPFRDAQLCLGRWQRVLLLGFDGASSPGGWLLTASG